MRCIRPRRSALNAHGVAKYLLSRAVRDAGYKVVITGEGSDEILGGYAHFRRDMLLYNREGQDPRRRRRDCSSSWNGPTRSHAACCCRTATSRPLDRVSAALGFVPSWMETFSARAAKMAALFVDGLPASVPDRARATARS